MKKNGFTLIELMIVVAILGILSAVAIPAYNSYVAVTKCMHTGKTRNVCEAEYTQIQGGSLSTAPIQVTVNSQPSHVFHHPHVTPTVPNAPSISTPSISRPEMDTPTISDSSDQNAPNIQCIKGLEFVNGKQVISPMGAGVPCENNNQ